MALPIIPQDKANHFIYGVVVSLAAMFVASTQALPIPLVVVGIVSAFVVGAIKEAVDYIQNKQAGTPLHGVELLDGVATGLGGVATSVTLLLQ